MPLRHRESRLESMVPCMVSKSTIPGQPTTIYNWDLDTLSYGSKPVGVVSKVDDESHPNYKRRKARGELIMGQFALNRVDKRVTGGCHILVGPTSGYLLNTGTWDVSGDIASTVVAGCAVSVNFGSDKTRVCDIALERAYKSMNSAPIMGGEIFHDLTSTMSMMRRPFGNAKKLLGKMIAHKEKHLGKTAFSAARATSNSWLEYRYGWNPIIIDACEIAKQAQTGYVKIGSARYVARGTEKCSRSTTQFFSTVILSDSVLANGNVTISEEFVANAGVIYQLSKVNEGLDRMLAVGGLTPRDMPALAWELIPYSFVADWFLGVGRWIEAIVPRSDVNILASWRTTVSKCTREFSGGPLSRTVGSPPKEFKGFWESWSETTDQVNRELNPVLSLTPSFSVNTLGPKQIADALSLSLGQINQMVRRMRH